MFAIQLSRFWFLRKNFTLSYNEFYNEVNLAISRMWKQIYKDIDEAYM